MNNSLYFLLGVLFVPIIDSVVTYTFVSDLPQVTWFSSGTSVSSTTKTGHNDMTEILLQVAYNTISQPNHIIFTV